MRKSLILICLCIFITASAENTEKAFSPHQVGFILGSSTGMGPSYKFWPGRFGIQLSFLPYKVDSEWDDLLDVQGIAQEVFNYERPTTGQDKFISLGLSGLWTFKQYKNYKLITYLGNHLILTNDKNIYNIGSGVGISFDKRVSFNVMLGYGAYDIIHDILFFPAAEIGFFIRFDSKK